MQVYGMGIICFLSIVTCSLLCFINERIGGICEWETDFVSRWFLVLYEYCFFPFKPTPCWFKTKDPFLGVQRAVGFKGTNGLIIQLHESFFFCVELF